MKKWLAVLSLLLCLTLIFTSCNNSSESSKPDKSDRDESNDETIITENDSGDETIDTEVDITDLKTIGEFSSAWQSIYDQNQKYIDEYEGLEILSVVMTGMCFVTSIQYDMLNLENKDGRYEGELMLAGYKNAFIEKDGKKLTFGYDHVLEEDGFSQKAKAGDRVVQEGVCNLDEVYYFDESFGERDGWQYDRSTNEFRLEKDGSMTCLQLTGSNLDFNGDEQTSSEFLYVRAGKDRLDFVIAKSDKIGTNYEVIFLKNNDDLTKEQAIELFKGAGYTIESSASVKDGKLVKD